MLITNHYPFGQGESFLEHEMPYLAAEFENILIVSKNVTSSQTYQLPVNVAVERVSVSSTCIENLSSAWFCMKNRKQFTALLKEELQYAKRRNKQGVFREAFQFLFKAFQLSRELKRLLKFHQPSGRICFYSYWANNSALAIALLSNQFLSIQVCRAHGGDLYEHRQKNNYLPFRKALLKNLTRLYPVSADGAHYLKTFDVDRPGSIERSYLGTTEPVLIHSTPKRTRFTVVSCSNLIPLKRVHLLIESIALLTEQVSWIHFGDGPLKDELVSLAQQKFSGKQNIDYTFKGFVSNSEIMDFYSTTFTDVFINVSQYEGIPVSMMEAQSFGIPIIGTDVGAVREIVNSETGILLPENCTPSILAVAIQQFYLQSPEATVSKRQTCRAHWAANFKAADNFSTFATKLKSLLNETSG